MDPRPLKLEEFLPYRLSFTTNGVSDLIASAYKALFDLSIAEWRVIAVVAEHRGVSQQEIVRITGMDKVSVSRAAIGLTRRELLRREPNTADRRSRRLILAHAGKALYADVAPKALELEHRIFAEFDATELAVLVATLRKIDNVVRTLRAAISTAVSHGRDMR